MNSGKTEGGGGGGGGGGRERERGGEIKREREKKLYSHTGDPQEGKNVFVAY